MPKKVITNGSAYTAYDVKAKQMVTIQNPHIVVKGKTRMVTGRSPVSGIRVFRILGRV